MRKILHLDLDAFFCAVEEQRRPELRSRAFAVGGRPNERGVVASCSYAARRFGVHSAMPMATALRLCPGLEIVPADHAKYSQASQRVMQLCGNMTPLLEQISIDEAFMDVSDLPEPPEQLARQLQARIDQETHLPCSLGVAANKLVAKIANDVGKAAHRGDGPPRAVTVVPFGGEQAFLAPLPIRMLWGVGKKTEIRMQGIGVKTIGDLMRINPAVLSQVFGRHGQDFIRQAQGIDDRPVVVEHEVKSISQEVTFDHDLGDLNAIRQTLQSLAAQVGFRLRKGGFSASTIRLKLRWADFTTLTRQVSVQTPLNQDGLLFDEVVQLLDNVWVPGKKVRLVGVGAGKLTGQTQQLSLFDSYGEKELRLLTAVDEIHEKFGNQAIFKGRAMKQKLPGEKE